MYARSIITLNNSIEQNAEGAVSVEAQITPIHAQNTKLMGVYVAIYDVSGKKNIHNFSSFLRLGNLLEYCSV